MRGADFRLYDAAKILVRRGQCHLHNRLGMSVDLLVKIDVPQNAVRFRDDRHAAVVFVNNLQCAVGQLKFFFAVHIRIAH